MRRGNIKQRLGANREIYKSKAGGQSRICEEKSRIPLIIPLSPLKRFFCPGVILQKKRCKWRGVWPFWRGFVSAYSVMWHFGREVGLMHHKCFAFPTGACWSAGLGSYLLQPQFSRDAWTFSFIFRYDEGGSCILSSLLVKSIHWWWRVVGSPFFLWRIEILVPLLLIFVLFPGFVAYSGAVLVGCVFFCIPIKC